MRYDRLFLDLDGTVYLDGKLIDNVDIELRKLAESGTKIHYITNNTSIATLEYYKKMDALNLTYDCDSLVSPTLILSEWLLEKGYDRVFSVGTKAFRAELEERAGSRQDESTPACVIIAFDRELSYEKIEHACKLINAGVPYYLTHIDKACPSHQGPIPDCGAISTLIEATTGVQPLDHFGKPGELMIRYLRGLVCHDENILVAGDRIYTDAEIGLRMGGDILLVCSGEYKRGTPVNPQIHVAETLAEFLRVIRLKPQISLGTV